MADLTNEDIIRISALAVLSLVAVSSNMIVCLAFYKTEKLRTSFSFLIVSLAVADMLTGFFVIPSYCVFIVEEGFHKTPIGFYVYAVYICLDIFCGITAIYNMTLMSIDRAMMLVYPSLHARTLARKEVMNKLLFIPWCLACIFLTPKVVEFTYKVDSKMVVLSYFTMAFAVPLTIIAISYGYIFSLHMKNIKLQGARVMKDLRMAYTVLAIIIIFVVCWTPFFSIMLYYVFCKPCEKLSGLLVVAKWLQFFHSCCNPFVYGILQPMFRKAFKEILQSCLCCPPTRNAHLEIEQQPISSDQTSVEDV